MNYRDAWEPGCWCIATLQLCERFSREEEDGPTHYPAQWIYFVWEPHDNALPHVEPEGWGILMNEPEVDLAEIIDGAPVYVLKEFEADWPTLLDILLACAFLSPWLEDIISGHRTLAARRRRERWMSLYGDDRPAFEAFIRKVLNDTTAQFKEV
jgi:hypothetical protein